MIVRGLCSTTARDGHGDIVLPVSAYDAAMRRGVANIALLDHHDPARPLGRIRALNLTARGLVITAELDPKLPGAPAVMAAITRREPAYGFSLGGKVLRVGRYCAPIDVTEISLTDRPANPDCVVFPSSWPAEWAELFADMDAAAMIAPTFRMPAIRYPEQEATR
ncbi:MAG: HK97 family phage prohead protease [Proteobacteria bacterium]|nr:HK97 family phage prohead protease [Pseudomonadota bacterium]